MHLKMIQFNILNLLLISLFASRVKNNIKLRRKFQLRYSSFSLFYALFLMYVFNKTNPLPIGTIGGFKEIIIHRLIPLMYVLRSFYFATEHEEVIPFGSFFFKNSYLSIFSFIGFLIYTPQYSWIPLLDLIYSIYKYGLPSTSSTNWGEPPLTGGADWF